MSSSRRDIGFVSFMTSLAPLLPPFGLLFCSPVGYSPFCSGEGALESFDQMCLPLSDHLILPFSFQSKTSNHRKKTAYISIGAIQQSVFEDQLQLWNFNELIIKFKVFWSKLNSLLKSEWRSWTKYDSSRLSVALSRASDIVPSFSWRLHTAITEGH